ncbi:MAG: hypothetical protein V1738_02455 [Patescibacteria group bacterium]
MVEFREFGWNVVTLTFLIIVISTIVGVWGMWKQMRTIWRRRSGESVSVILFSYAVVYMSAGIVYGFQIGSLALILDLPWAIVTFIALLGLWKFSGSRIHETILAVIFLLAGIAMVCLPYRFSMYTGFCVGNCVAMTTQPYKMWRSGTRGSVDVRFLWTLVVTCAVWTVYGFAIGDWVVPFANLAYGLIALFAAVLWYRLPSSDDVTARSVE